MCVCVCVEWWGRCSVPPVYGITNRNIVAAIFSFYEHVRDAFRPRQFLEIKSDDRLVVKCELKCALKMILQRTWHLVTKEIISLQMVLDFLGGGGGRGGGTQ